MKFPRILAASAIAVAAGLLGVGLLLGAAHRTNPVVGIASLPVTVHPPAVPPVDSAAGPTPLQLILAPPPGAGDTTLDKQILREQADIRRVGQPAETRLAAVERLGWLFVAQAAAQDDEGSNKLAEQCAAVIDAEQPGSPSAKLLRGHVLHQFHRFKEAEMLARELVAVRRMPYDFGLLGDSLMEQGRLQEAVPAYQTMIDLKPGFESFVRAAHVRWLKGDLPGARAMMDEVLGMIHPRETATVAWAEGRVALYELQGGNLPAARQHAEAALQAKASDAPAHLVLARVLSFEGKEDEALEHYRAAAKTRPLPEFLWALADHLEARGLTAEAVPVEQTLRQTGRRADPRTLSLYLATTRQSAGDAAEALQLAQAETQVRQDVFTWDALAWSQFAAGQVPVAQESMRHALAEGTREGRFFVHAAVIAAAAGDAAGQRDFAAKAAPLRQMLLSSECRLLDGQK